MQVCEWRYRGSLDDWSLGLGILLLLLAGQTKHGDALAACSQRSLKCKFGAQV